MAKSLHDIIFTLYHTHSGRGNKETMLHFEKDIDKLEHQEILENMFSEEKGLKKNRNIEMTCKREDKGHIDNQFGERV